MFNIFVGDLWMVIFVLAAIILGVITFFAWENHKGTSVVMAIVATVALVFAVVAGTSFRVSINSKALLINTLDQTVVGVRESGVQKKAFIGNAISEWPINGQYPVSFSLGKETGVKTSSVTNKNGSPVALDVTVYLDLSNLNIVEAFKAFNGDFEAFKSKFLVPQLGNLTRDVTRNYSSWDLDTKRPEWVRDYEANVMRFIESGPGKQFGLKLVVDRTVILWDFVEKSDAEAFDNANRAGYSIQQREFERQALLVEAQMTQIRSNMVISTTGSTISSLSEFSNFIQRQPAEMRPYIMGYLPTLEALEYLRTVNALKPDSVFPPSSGPVLTYGVNPPSITSTPVLTR